MRAELRCQHCGTAKTSGSQGRGHSSPVDADARCWLIEVKDYRRIASHEDDRDSADEVALKVRDSLALLAVASKNANDPQEKSLAKDAIRCPVFES